MLGNAFSRVEYVRGTDSTLAGSRDALGPLLLWLQEVRFSVLAIREIYSRCMQNRRILCDLFLKSKIAIEICTPSVVGYNHSSSACTQVISSAEMGPCIFDGWRFPYDDAA